MDQFAASLSASQDSRPSPQFPIKKGKISRLSINVQDCVDSKGCGGVAAQQSDLPMIDIKQKQSL